MTGLSKDMIIRFIILVALLENKAVLFVWGFFKAIAGQ